MDLASSFFPELISCLNLSRSFLAPGTSAMLDPELCLQCHLTAMHMLFSAQKEHLNVQKGDIRRADILASAGLLLTADENTRSNAAVTTVQRNEQSVRKLEPNCTIVTAPIIMSFPSHPCRMNCACSNSCGHTRWKCVGRAKGATKQLWNPGGTYERGHQVQAVLQVDHIGKDARCVLTYTCYIRNMVLLYALTFKLTPSSRRKFGVLAFDNIAAVPRLGSSHPANAKALGRGVTRWFQRTAALTSEATHLI
jgi:hypothetical protein